jgi:hypothetical protein
MHGDHETGSTYNYASVRDKNAISASRYRSSRTPKSMEHRLTWSSVLFSMTSTYLDACETGSIYLGRIDAELYRISCWSMFHWLWRPQKPMSRRRNCISISYQRTVITISGFVVAMHPWQYSCRTIQNFMRWDEIEKKSWWLNLCFQGQACLCWSASASTLFALPINSLESRR